MRKGAFTDVRHVRHPRQIAHLKDEARHLRQRLDPFAAEDIETHFTGEIGNHCANICITATLAEAIDCSLHMSSACLNSSESVGICTVAVVVSMNANYNGTQLSTDGLCDFVNLVRQSAAVSIAKRNHIGTSISSCVQNLHCIFRIFAVAIVKVLGVKNETRKMWLEKGDGVPNHFEVSLSRYAQDLLYVQVPAFPHNGDHVG